MRRPAVVLWAALAGVLLVVPAFVVLRPVLFPPPQPLVAAAWLPLSSTRAPESLRTALADGGLTEVSPTWANVLADGQLLVKEIPPEVQALLDRPDVRVLPTVQNYGDGAWQGQMVADVLSDPQRERAHRATLVAAAVENGWDGLDIDYENLPPTAGPQFTDFLGALRDDLHEHGLELTVAVPARSSDEDPGTFAYSYQALGEVADEVRVMTYDHSWDQSEPGAVAPLPWVKDVVEYAVARVPRDKLMLGLATYGYDWVGSTGTTLQSTDAVALARQVGARPEWNSDAAAHTFTYESGGQQHTVWYEDARSLALKQDLAVRERLRGVAIWSLGGEDPQVWTSVAGAARGRADR
jgi:spore germination protein YaaH